ncbi:T9SS type A sorting domain-containing protein [Chryseobacterium daecheongense]|uniref:T9SS type A sorting domain-containing protein n=1 Tax=Chryseobacterium daecheongense TaxID=192389 RepID=UPI001FD6CCE6|nr:T9SS type A sorting domain-containing protein [Chryseobacterium daecheongense]UOU99630.1 T9SS type A sorting domain-containing protein [Chryseobacterium daecheongense]
MNNLTKNLTAIFCLASVWAYSTGNAAINDASSVRKQPPDLYRKTSDTLIKASASGKSVAQDWTKAPNSYIFDPAQNNEGLYIPVRKAYAMWEQDKYLKGNGIPVGKVTADVLWEDVHGLIKSGQGYALEVVDSGPNAKIKVPVNKSKKGNAVIVLRVNDEIFWSWHIWVTDNPSNGSAYKSFTNLKREKSDGTLEPIPDTDWGWMDRNLGAISSSITASDWNRNSGLLYQWGRKDPIPPLVWRGNDFYEVSGSIGRVRHRGAVNNVNAVKIDDLRRFVLLSNANLTNNIRLSVKNPLSLIYVNKDDNSGPAYYNNNANLPVNWFGTFAGLAPNQLSELNLWSDNSKGIVAANYNDDNNANPYRDKSSYDPCPNGWRIPSVLVANLASASYVDDVRIDFSPFGVRTNMPKNVFQANNYHIIKPTDASTPTFMKGFKIYPNFGFDLSNVNGFNMGIFPGTGQILLNFHNGQYTDQHQTALWTATMARHFDATPAVGARALSLIPDKGQTDVPDAGFPDVKGRYWYSPLSSGPTSNAVGCRCIKDPLYVINNYNFPTEYLTPASEYKEGIDHPNTYQIVKNTVISTVEIPVSKAFSVQSELLNNKMILNSSSFSNLKANVLWSTNMELINKVTMVNPSPGTLDNIVNTKILVEIKPNQSGNAVITLHNENTTSPVYWSWHIWVTDTPVSSNMYTTELPNTSVTNYVNYVNKADNVFQTEFMDRNLGATDAFPVVVNPLTPTTAELAKIRAATGLHYQWGRKDPLPVFQFADNRASYNIFLGNVTASGSVTYSTLQASAYNNMSGNYIVPYNTYAGTANVQASDKVSEKVAKIIAYSAGNPLVYMIPSTFAPYNSAVPNYTNGSDWLSPEPNLAPDRWGRGGEKSPFDPCPAGWRIPDLTGVAIVSNKDFGLTPFYKKDKNVATSYSIINDYLGIRVRNPSTTSTIGYTFNDTSYKIGNYPNSGSRGFRSVTGNQTAQGTFNFINFQYPGIWTAALNSNYIGRPINVLFNAASSANRIIAFHDNNDPYFGMSCRCVKIKYDANGNEEGVVPKLQITSLPATKAAAPLSKTEIGDKIKANKITVYPNPVKNVLYINASVEKGYYYQIYNVSGQLVKSGKFENKQTDLSALVTGTYLMRINNEETVVKIIKE